MTLRTLLQVTTLAFMFHCASSVETISDYAKVVKNAEKSAAETVETEFPTEAIRSNSSEISDYEDFDDLEEDRSLERSTATETTTKYLRGLISLLALMYKFNGRVNDFQNQNEASKPRDIDLAKSINNLKDTGKRFQEAQERFEFPQKKFRESFRENIMDEEFQPVETYPPYNPLTANNAESYSDRDKKTSYEAYDNANPIGHYENHAQTHQSHSYVTPFNMEKRVKQNGNGLPNGDEGTSWSVQQAYPVYQPVTVDSYRPWKAQDDIEPSTHDSGTGQQPWKSKPPKEYVVHHHDFKDSLPPEDDRYHEDEPSFDEDRVSKKPYSYYFLGRKLWYIPLLFSVYFIIYIGALVLKSLARHKIQFPEKVWDLHDDKYGLIKHRRYRKIDDITRNYENAVEKIKNKFM